MGKALRIFSHLLNRSLSVVSFFVMGLDGRWVDGRIGGTQTKKENATKRERKRDKKWGRKQGENLRENYGKITGTLRHPYCYSGVLHRTVSTNNPSLRWRDARGGKQYHASVGRLFSTVPTNIIATASILSSLDV